MAEPSNPLSSAVMFLRDAAKPVLFRRSFRAYGVGTPKSGTHSVVQLLSPVCRSSHEPRPQALADVVSARAAGTMDASDLRRWLRSRDRRLWLDFEASHPLHYLVDLIATEFPEARFVLTVRDCYSWLDSEINQNLVSPDSGPWYELRRLRYSGRGYSHGEPESTLQELGLEPLAAYLEYWAEHHERVVAAVPPERLMVVRTADIGPRAAELADFVGADGEAVDPERGHAYARDHRPFDLFQAVDPGYLDDLVGRLASRVMADIYPEVTSVRDLRR